MPEDLPRTEIDSFFRHEWQFSSAVRPEWTKGVPSVPLFREAYFGRCALAEPVRGRQDGPPYVVCTYPNDEYIHALNVVMTTGGPAHAGIDPTATLTATWPTRWPRTRGDRPPAPLAGGLRGGVAPHTRG